MLPLHSGKEQALEYALQLLPAEQGKELIEHVNEANALCQEASRWVEERIAVVDPGLLPLLGDQVIRFEPAVIASSPEPMVVVKVDRADATTRLLAVELEPSEFPAAEAAGRSAESSLWSLAEMGERVQLMRYIDARRLRHSGVGKENGHSDMSRLASEVLPNPLRPMSMVDVAQRLDSMEASLRKAKMSQSKMFAQMLAMVERRHKEAVLGATLRMWSETTGHSMVSPSTAPGSRSTSTSSMSRTPAVARRQAKASAKPASVPPSPRSGSLTARAPTQTARRHMGSSSEGNLVGANRRPGVGSAVSIPGRSKSPGRAGSQSRGDSEGPASRSKMYTPRVSREPTPSRGVAGSSAAGSKQTGPYRSTPRSSPMAGSRDGRGNGLGMRLRETTPPPRTPSPMSQQATSLSQASHNNGKMGVESTWTPQSSPGSVIILCPEAQHPDSVRHRKAGVPLLPQDASGFSEASTSAAGELEDLRQLRGELRELSRSLRGHIDEQLQKRKTNGGACFTPYSQGTPFAQSRSTSDIGSAAASVSSMAISTRSGLPIANQILAPPSFSMFGSQAAPGPPGATYPQGLATADGNLQRGWIANATSPTPPMQGHPPSVGAATVAAGMTRMAVSSSAANQVHSMLRGQHGTPVQPIGLVPLPALAAL
eukprot:TRINITY_DN113011_c0_g1_i1.p1 TRINITY_DN113011_c0_g1~~TRINITY_DN113011_c0_g1_i1.p1  ORF type:complete len:655 (+),score=106.33 TRINITY_DN113011_c0_g1_i1:83-2047(+)